MNQFLVSHRPFLRVLMCLAIVSLASACTTMQPLDVSSTANLANRLDVGDKVEVTRNDGAVMTFKISEMSDTGISGEGQSVAYADIREVKTSKIKVGPTVGIAVGIAAVAAIAGSGGSGSTY